jgi:DNA-binding transcriptional MerR regulator
MRDLISIGRFAQITQLSIKALHIYDALGLLRPVFIDAGSSYRYYSITQLPLARRIRLLRSIDMSLDSIHALLHAPTSAAMDALLHEHQQRIADRIRKDQQALHLLQHIIDHQADDLVFSVNIKDVPAQQMSSAASQPCSMNWKATPGSLARAARMLRPFEFPTPIVSTWSIPKLRCRSPSRLPIPSELPPVF